MPRISIAHISGTKDGLAESFEQDVVKVGRETDNDIQYDPFEELQVSGHHAELCVVESKWLIVDLGSSNGTFVDGEQIDTITPLSVGSEVRFGKKGPRVRIEALETQPDDLPRTELAPKASPDAAPAAPQAAPAAPPPPRPRQTLRGLPHGRRHDRQAEPGLSGGDRCVGPAGGGSRGRRRGPTPAVAGGGGQGSQGVHGRGRCRTLRGRG